MNKNIYVKLFLNTEPLKCTIFFPNKQRNVIVNNNSVTSLLLDTFEFIEKTKLDYPIILFSDEVILVNILNEHKDHLKTNNKWSGLCNYMLEKKLRLQAYTMVE